MILFKIFMSTIACIGIINPKHAWKMGGGWKQKNVEPSENYFKTTRVVSAALLLFIWLIFPNG
ncbi:MAG TPA: histidine kinase [Syntrophomonadaceae bacterium]|nr:histidine kinase [Syntrophomonadaceae bacterium]